MPSKLGITGFTQIPNYLWVLIIFKWLKYELMIQKVSSYPTGVFYLHIWIHSLERKNSQNEVAATSASLSLTFLWQSDGQIHSTAIQALLSEVLMLVNLAVASHFEENECNTVSAVEICDEQVFQLTGQSWKAPLNI